MFTGFRLLVLATLCFSLKATLQNPDKPDYTKEPMVIQNMTTEVTFSQSGAREWRQTLSVRVQSEAMLRQLGVLSFPYASASEEVTVDYVRVQKTDGTIITTPASSMVDTAAEIATVAPTYSDLRQKQIPVKALAVGDILEYSVRTSQQTPEVPNEFWYQQGFPDDTVVLSESLKITVPRATHLLIVSPRLKYDSRDDSDLRVYTWKYSQLAATELKASQQKSPDDQSLTVRVTTFKNWEEVGTWWGTLAAPEVTSSPAIQQKAKELTAGLSNETEKARAIYNYVSMKFRYISISFGVGRFRPHTADEVLANQYGDCKDKHTLLAALLKAGGIEAWPALIGAGTKFDASVPSPDQFNHVITVLPQKGSYTWLDTTQEVAQFGLLNQMIRDQQALVVPTGGKPFLMKTPPDPPFRSSQTVDVRSSLSEDGSLTGQFDIQMVGDGASSLRSAFRQLAPVQWQALAQQISGAMNYAGEVSSVEVENLEDPDKPFHYKYDYKRDKYSDWAEAKITPPLPPLGFGPGDEGEKPKEPFWTGEPGEIKYSATVLLPKGFSIEVPQNVSVSTDFADYTAQYSLKDRSFLATRTMTIKKSKVTLDEWDHYREFAKQLQADQNQFLMLGKADETPKPEPRPSVFKDPAKLADPFQLLAEAQSAGRDYNKTIGLTQQANAIWKKRAARPPEYADSLVMFSLAQLADDYQTGDNTAKDAVYSRWKSQTSSSLAEAVEFASTTPDVKSGTLALALELQALQLGDTEEASKLRTQAGNIRSDLVSQIMPEPPLLPLASPADEPLHAPRQVKSPTLAKKIEAEYSDAAREARIEGLVTLSVVVEKDGTPSSAHLLKPVGFGLDEEAAKAVKKWRFNPGTLEGTPVRVRATIEVAFKLL